MTKISKTLPNLLVFIGLNCTLAHAAHGATLSHEQNSGTTATSLTDSQIYENAQAAALKGSPEAMFELAGIYRSGKGALQSKLKSSYWLKKAAEAGLPPAQLDLGRRYLYGLTPMKKDPVQARFWLQKAADQGYEEAKKQLAESFPSSPAATPSHSTTSSPLQESVPQVTTTNTITNEQRAFERTKIKANTGSTKAMLKLSERYRTGTGVQKNESQANYWLEKAAEKGNPRAQYTLGMNYINGNGVPQDQAKARIWLQQAANQHYGPAKQVLLNSFPTPTVSPSSQPLQESTREPDNSEVVQAGIVLLKQGKYLDAIRKFQYASNLGSADAMFQLAKMHAQGQGFEPNPREASAWYERAAKKGHIRAQYILGMSYINGYGVKKDLTTARIWLQKAADQGYARAKTALATL